MNHTYEEWEIIANDGKSEWTVSESYLPTSSREEALTWCNWFRGSNPHVNYTPKGFRVTRTPMEVKEPSDAQ